jgi:membrane-bound serine protease (ClpP class)
MRFPSSLLLTALLAVPCAAATTPVVRMVEFAEPVTPVSAGRVVDVIEAADREGDDLVLIRLDTPGGLVSSLERIVQSMLQARTPVVVWVGPSGAKAASAGFLILIAADVAAMAPGTHTGAAAVISNLFGANPEGDVSLKKASADVAARARTLAEHRGRNVEAAERAVTTAEAYTDGQALADGLIDLIAKDVDELLERLDGRTVKRFDGSETVLVTRDARVIVVDPTLRQQILGVLANPLVSYLLLLLGLGGLYVELSHPGLIFPGLVGILCLLLFAFSAQVLPVSAVGVLLILLAVVLFVLEIKVVSYGMLTVGGVVSLVIGSLILFQGPIPELRLQLGVVLPASLTLAALCAMVVRLAVRAQLEDVATGVEGLRSEIATVTQDLDPEGKVFVHGETWTATSRAGPIRRGTRVRIVEVKEMILRVEPVPNDSNEGS